MSQQQDAPANAVTVLQDVDEHRLAAALQQPIRACVEAGTEHFLASMTGQFVIVLTTATAFTMDPGTIFTDAVIGRGLLRPARREDLRLALHEALANGLIHGNLELPSQSALSPGAFIEHATTMEARLASKDYGARPIALALARHGNHVEISVSDCGCGFSPRPIDLVDAGEMSGRGLYLMTQHCDQLRHEDAGRRVVLCYRDKIDGGTGD